MVAGWRCWCERCGHRWDALGKNPPVACARCKSRSWDIAPKTVGGMGEMTFVMNLAPPGSLKPGRKTRGGR
jgi:hypothetical protein